MEAHSSCKRQNDPSLFWNRFRYYLEHNKIGSTAIKETDDNNKKKLIKIFNRISKFI